MRPAKGSLLIAGGLCGLLSAGCTNSQLAMLNSGLSAAQIAKGGTPNQMALAGGMGAYSDAYLANQRNMELAGAITGAGKDIRAGIEGGRNDPYSKPLGDGRNYDNPRNSGRWESKSGDVDLSTLVGKTVSENGSNIYFPARPDDTYIGLITAFSDKKEDRGKYHFTWSPFKNNPELFYAINPVTDDDVYTATWNDKNNNEQVDDGELTRTSSFGKKDRVSLVVRIGAIARGKTWGSKINARGEEPEGEEKSVVDNDGGTYVQHFDFGKVGNPVENWTITVFVDKEKYVTKEITLK